MLSMGQPLFLFKANTPSVCIYHILLINLSYQWNLGLCHPLAMVNNAAIDMGVQVSF
jgi:hypothetical protein